MKTEEKIESIIAPIIDEMGYEIVRVMLMGQARPTLQIMIDNKNGKPIIVDDCVKVSKAIEEPLDLNIDIEYVLEVSSPGVDRPLTKIEHFEKFVGFEAKIDTLTAVEERKRFKGKLLSVKGDKIEIETDGNNYTVSFDNVLKSKLVLTDELLKSYQQQIEEN
ncbi:MAG: ribosome maturation factor RimP [Alphaproteobacteria bacterium]|nr:ribosome maturation factor RimP [Alphaproteobacteria bacterium]